MVLGCSRRILAAAVGVRKSSPAAAGSARIASASGVGTGTTVGSLIETSR